MRGVLTTMVSLVATATMSAGEPECRCLTGRDLVRWSCTDLERLYRQGEACPLPDGYYRGTAIFQPGTPWAVPRSRLTRLLWHGKHIHTERGEMVNQLTGLRAMPARLDLGPSWLDGQPAVLFDYRGQSVIYRDVRDEVRRIGPGLYLGLMYRDRCKGPQFECFFVLEACP